MTSPGDPRAAHPDWALAYILQDWKRRGRKALETAYEASCEGGGVAEEERDRLLAEALKRMRVYVAALEQVSS